MDNVITMKKNGTTFTVVLRSAESAKLSFEDLMKKMITDDAVQLEPIENAELIGIGDADEESISKLSQL